MFTIPKPTAPRSASSQGDVMGSCIFGEASACTVGKEEIANNNILMLSINMARLTEIVNIDFDNGSSVFMGVVLKD